MPEVWLCKFCGSPAFHSMRPQPVLWPPQLCDCSSRGVLSVMSQCKCRAESTRAGPRVEGLGPLPTCGSHHHLTGEGKQLSKADQYYGGPRLLACSSTQARPVLHSRGPRACRSAAWRSWEKGEVWTVFTARSLLLGGGHVSWFPSLLPWWSRRRACCVARSDPVGLAHLPHHF